MNNEGHFLEVRQLAVALNGHSHMTMSPNIELQLVLSPICCGAPRPTKAAASCSHA
jgi:hypothetical protein